MKNRKNKKSTPRRENSHVRLYAYELESEAYRSLSPEARALLVEMRALFNPNRPTKGNNPNRIYLSVREIMRRLGVTQRPAMRAKEELVDRGFIRLVSAGTVSATGSRQAAVYALTNEPDDPSQNGATPTKDFMRWHRAPTLSSGSATVSSGIGYYSPSNSEAREGISSGIGYYQPQKGRNLVAAHATQISYQGAVAPDVTRARLQLAFIFWQLVILALERGEL